MGQQLVQIRQRAQLSRPAAELGRPPQAVEIPPHMLAGLPQGPVLPFQGAEGVYVALDDHNALRCPGGGMRVQELVR